MLIAMHLVKFSSIGFGKLLALCLLLLDEQL